MTNDSPLKLYHHSTTLPLYHSPIPNDRSLKLLPPLEKSFSIIYNAGMNKRQTKKGFYCTWHLSNLRLAPLIKGGQKKYHGSIW
jgi:hypothetical protein